ncbi:MAG TPA: fumarylacetoacetate hydrolase family protein [Solirubrobacteraceae bacterium]|jgi:2-keto-4-pentenoate hydratase/2-oxohepta-3-ene-1,7-dioic acid hydratase in catechol pathway|nr:fumarylacetoacetate hydrolase family protein [Solirubrobacteraceae bacterium]
MRLATFLAPASDTPRAGEVREQDGEQRVFGYALEELTVLDRLADPGATPVEGESWRLDQVTLLAPVPTPRAIFGIGLNYADHVRETGRELPEQPLVFMKLPSSAAAPGAPVHCPQVVRRLDYEGELAVIMGPGRSVAGYAVADDVTARDLQGREPQWTRAKGADGFCPYGPWITTADEIPDPHQLALRTWVNGELRQDSNTSNLIFSIPQLIEFISQACTLQTGDVILTGTPSGVGVGQSPPTFLASDDVIRIEIQGLGAIEHAVA